MVEAMKLFSPSRATFAALLAFSTMTTHARPTAAEIVAKLGLEKIPHEGPWFVQSYKGGGLVGGELGARYADPHSAYTAIYALLTRNDFSAMHRLATDELWHFYGGDPIELLLLYPDGRGETVIMGPDIMAGQRPQFLVPHGVWQGARPLGSDDAWSLIGNTLSPGFEYADYTPGYRKDLWAGWPAFAKKIAERTRDDSIAPPADATVVAPVADLVEIVGRNLPGPQHSEQLSVARFRQLPGAALAERRNRVSAEAILVLSGTMEFTLAGKMRRVGSGEVALAPANTPYSIAAAGEQPLEAYAVCAPAFAPEQHLMGAAAK